MYTVTGSNESGRTTVALTLEVLPGFVTTTGQTTTERMRGPSATPLSNGLVLIVGGIGYSGELLPRAGLYDPETQQFTATGSMNAEQSSFQPALLPDGKVLMACGQDGDGEPIERPEVYDPDSGTFALTSAMIRRRILCTVALLGNGKVLVAGGMTTRLAGGVTRTAELYDPETGSFSATGDMTIERFDGMPAITGNHVLVAGGLGATYSPTAVAERKYTIPPREPSRLRAPWRRSASAPPPPCCRTERCSLPGERTRMRRTPRSSTASERRSGGWRWRRAFDHGPWRPRLRQSDVHLMMPHG